MGLFDRLTIEDGLDLPLPGFEGDRTTVTWQTKSVDRPAMRNYKITMDGRLFRERTRTETVPEEERPRYDESIEGFEREFERGLGSLRTVHLAWTDTEYHGVVEFHRHIEGEGYSYEATFTHGDLEGFEETERY